MSERRRVRAILSLGVAAASVASVAIACTTDYQKGLDDPRYGAPNALANQKQPGPSSDYTNGASSGPGGSSSGAPQPVCVQQGKTLLVDAGACSVSFKTDILGAFGASSPTCASTSSCHGGQNPANQPRIDQGDPAGTYREFAAFKLSTGVPYINPCSTNETESGIACNIAEAGGCGAHMPVGGQIAADVVAKFTTWLKCGSPNN